MLSFKEHMAVFDGSTLGERIHIKGIVVTVPGQTLRIAAL